MTKLRKVSGLPRPRKNKRYLVISNGRGKAIVQVLHRRGKKR